MKILICGLPGSGKTTLAEKLAKQIDAGWLNADDIRKEFNDWDFTTEGRMRQAIRMKTMAASIDTLIDTHVIMDFVCPTKELRGIVNADFVIWMDTISESRFADTNAIYEPLTEQEYDVRITTWTNQVEDIAALITGNNNV